MKKILTIIMLIALLPVSATISNSNDFDIYPTEKYESRYETWEFDGSDEELVQYYLENDIKPASIKDGVGVKLKKDDVSGHLASLYPEYSSWEVSTNTGFVSDVYGNNPREIDEWNRHVQEAKQKAGLNKNYIGCGPLAILSQFDYLANYAGYISIANNLEDFNDASLEEAPNFVSLATEIFKNTYTIPADSFLGELFGVDPNAGTFTFPSEVMSSSMEILEKHGLAKKTTIEEIDNEGNIQTTTSYEGSQIMISGDSIPSLSSFSTKINNLKDSIDRGMPVLWWTLGGDKAAGFANHFMNIFGYEYWIGTDTNGNTMTHLMFILRYNWGEDDIYMDSDVLDAVNGGFIFFEETNLDKSLIRAEDYGYDCQYYFDEKQKYITPSMGRGFTTNFLRTGYVNRYDSTNTKIVDQQVSLSAKRANAGEAYIHYIFEKPVKWMYLEYSWWSGSEGITSLNGEVKLQYKKHSADWQTASDLLNDAFISIFIDDKSKIIIEFDCPVTEVRLLVKTNDPSGSRNKGRIVIGDILVLHDDASKYYTYTQDGKSGHIATCACGYSSHQPHSAKSAPGNKRYVNCSQCGYLIDLGTDIIIGYI